MNDLVVAAVRAALPSSARGSASATTGLRGAVEARTEAGGDPFPPIERTPLRPAGVTAGSVCGVRSVSITCDIMFTKPTASVTAWCRSRAQAPPCGYGRGRLREHDVDRVRNRMVE